MAKVSLCEWIKALLSNFCVKIFSQNSLIPIQTLNGFFIFYCATWARKIWFPFSKIRKKILSLDVWFSFSRIKKNFLSREVRFFFSKTSKSTFYFAKFDFPFPRYQKAFSISQSMIFLFQDIKKHFLSREVLFPFSKIKSAHF